ncbi:MAG: P1 family peptidase [Planctomycetales bacterium]|nr:P1 family peptidase [Planctomycetales bacterium]
MSRNKLWMVAMVAVSCAPNSVGADEPPESRPRLRQLGIAVGVLPTGAHNAITDVAGVQVGHRTLLEGDSIRTGVTAISPHPGNVFLQKCPAAIHVANGFGKFVGSTQIDELGVLETPIVLTNTLSTFAAADALVDWVLNLDGCEQVRSVNPVVGECNDGHLNDIRARRVARDDVRAALQSARGGEVEEGCVGAGAGTRCLGWKGGIGTSSRKLPDSLGGHTVGVLVQTNFGGMLTVAGVPVGRELGNFFLQDAVKQEHGSCIVIVATDAPIDARQLKRIARRAPLGLAATGSPITHGSGDYVLAFSTHESLRTDYLSESPVETTTTLRDDRLSPLFQAVKEATEEAVINSMLKAVTTTGHAGSRVEAIDPARVVEICRQHGLPAKLPGHVSRTPRSAPRHYAEQLGPATRAKIEWLESHVDELLRQHHVPGVAVAIIDNRQLVWSRGYGVRCAGAESLVEPDTVMEACSMSKPLFAYLFLRMIEDGTFELDRPLVEYLGKDYWEGEPRQRRITARHVLTHTSGLPNWREGGWRSNNPLSLAVDPGAEFRYSGEGFLMLQRAVEHHLKSDLRRLAQERLLAPLQLAHTSFRWDDRFVVRAACGHDSKGNTKSSRNYYQDPNAAYSLYTTAEDYARFLVDILSDDRKPAQRLSADMRAEMLKPASHRDEQDADWGLGWGLKVVANRRRAFHSGANGTGFRCHSEFDLQQGEGFVIMTNAIGGAALWKDVVSGWEHLELPAERR